MIQLRSILDAYPANVVVLDHRGMIRQANAAWEQLAKQSEAPLGSYGIGSTFLQFCRTSGSPLADIASSVEKQIHQLLAGEISEFSEDWRSGAHPTDPRHLVHGHRVAIGRSGSPYFLLTHETIPSQRSKATGTSDENANALIASTVCRLGKATSEIGQIAHAGNEMEALREKAALLQVLSDSVEECFWFMKVNPEQFLYISTAIETVMGWKPQKFYEDAAFWLHSIHEHDRNRVEEAYRDWLSERNPQYRTEFRFKSPDGEIRWLAHRGILLHDQAGTARYATVFVKDISSQKQAEEELRRLSGQLISAQEEERKRLARELHDHVSQTLTLLSVELEQLDRDEEITIRQHDAVITMRHQLKGLSSDLHALSHQLHPSKLKHLGLVSAMRSMCREMEQGGLTVKFSDQDVPRQLPDDVSLTLYRVMQEGLQNIRKHSGANSAEAELKKTSTYLIFRLRDQGKGFDLQAIKSGEGLGLSSMRERLNAVKGSLVIQSAPNRGTLLEASVPLPDGETRTT